MWIEDVKEVCKTPHFMRQHHYDATRERRVVSSFSVQEVLLEHQCHKYTVVLISFLGHEGVSFQVYIGMMDYDSVRAHSMIDLHPKV